MDRNKHDTSSYSVPGILQDQTLLGTPQPRASSTATKKRLSLLTDEIEHIAMMDSAQNAKADSRNVGEQKHPDYTQSQSRLRAKECNLEQQASLLKQNMDAMQERLEKELAAQKVSTTSKHPISGFDKHEAAALHKFLEGDPSNFDKSSRLSFDKKTVSCYDKKCNTNDELGRDFQFLVPATPYSKYNSDSGRKGVQLDKSLLNISSDFPAKQLPTEVPERLSGMFQKLSAQDKERREYDRISCISSSANSSLGLITADMLEDARDKPLVQFSEEDKLDLSQRLAHQLNLDKSLMKDSSLDISQLGSAHLKYLVTKGKENKEKKRASCSSYNYSDSSSNSKNTTVKEFSRLSLNIDGIELPVQDLSRAKSKPLTELNSNWNSLCPRDNNSLQSTNSERPSYQFSEGRQSMGSNPFGDYSKFSIASDEFQSGEDVVERLASDEEAWRGELGHQSLRSLSGIYGGGDISIRTHGEKLSISSFLRSGSGPLGCLETKGADCERPTFGGPVFSPEKKGKVHAIRPPPEKKHTFSVEDEIPVKDEGPWDPQALLDQYSLVHEGAQDCDVSVPSLSTIGKLLNDMGDDLTPKELLKRLMASKTTEIPETSSVYQTKHQSVHSSKNISHCDKKEKLKTSVLAGENSFCRGYESDRSARYSSSFSSHLSLGEQQEERYVQQKVKSMTQSLITIDDSIADSVCNVTDFGNENDEYVCVLTPESMDFDIFNDLPRTQHYEITKSCYLNGQRKDTAAIIHLPITSLALQPKQQRTVSVKVAPLVSGTIKIKLDVTRTDSKTQEKEANSVFGKIVAELPKISLLGPTSVELKLLNDQNAAFCGEYQEVIEIKNNGRSMVPLRLVLDQMSHRNIFFLNPQKTTSTTHKLEPGQICRQVVSCHTPPIFETSISTAIPVSARLDVYLATSDQVSLPALAFVSLHARLRPNFFCAPSNLLVSAGHSEKFHLVNSGSVPATIKAVASLDFSVRPEALAVNPGQVVTITVGHADCPKSSKKGTLTLLEDETSTSFTINLQERVSPRPSSGSFVTPLSSRATSPTSPCSSRASSEGVLQIACTHKEMVWGGCPLQQRVVKVCTLKNLSIHREKLLLRVKDTHNCFKILNDKNDLVTEFKLSIQPVESRQITLVVIAGTAGPKWGHLTITRINSPLDKKVLPMFAFGGKARLTIEGVLHDPEQHMWLYLDSSSLSNSFTLTNTGDYTAFFKITEGTSATTIGGGLSIAPPEQILPAGCSVSVEIALSITPERLEYLLAQPSQTTICVARLTVIHGDESTRLRMSRLGRLNPLLDDKLFMLSQLLSAQPIPDIDKLEDSSSCAESLWLDDVNEWTIGVLVKRSALDALRLDTSVEFVDLATTIIQ